MILTILSPPSYSKLLKIEREGRWGNPAMTNRVIRNIFDNCYPNIFYEQTLSSQNQNPSRAEMIDAAIAERAKYVMLNKEAYITEAVTILDNVLTRMETH